jgi:multidrug efflux pump subunit AcrA (membrane-fusion protein)
LARFSFCPQSLSGAPALVVASALALLVAGCHQEAKTEPPQPRPVRTVTVEKGEVGDSVVLTGDIRAENEVNLAFRIGGRIIERKGEVGDKVEPDQVLAKLDPQDELNGLRSAQAGLAAAAAQAAEAQNNFDRQNHLMERGFTTRDLRFCEAGTPDCAGAGRQRDRATGHRSGPGGLHRA